MIRIILILLFVSATSASACLHCAWNAAGTASSALTSLFVPVLNAPVSEKPVKLVKPKTAKQQYAIGYGTLFVDNKRWTKSPEVIIEDAAVNLVHADGNAYIAGMTNTQFVPIDAFVEQFLGGLRSDEQNKDVRLIEKRNVEVNGVKMTELVIHVTINDTPFMYDVLVHTGSKGMIMMMSWTHSEIFEELKADMMSAFSGLVIKK